MKVTTWAAVCERIIFSQMSKQAVRIIDLSVRLQNAAMEGVPQDIRYITHAEQARSRARAEGIEVDAFPDCIHGASEIVTASTHAGTHMDAPYHMGPTAAGKRNLTIDEVPLEWCYGAGVVLDFSDRPAGDLIRSADVQAALAQIGHVLQAGDILLIRTDATLKYDRQAFVTSHPGLSAGATRWLLAQGVRVIGIDAWSLDRPIPTMVRALAEGDKEQFFGAHLVGREVGFCIVEKLANLHLLPATGFTVALFPVKIERASGAWVRAVAILPPEDNG